MQNFSKLSLVFLCVSFPLTVTAKTFYVEKWGTDSVGVCGAKSDPCETIQQAIDNAGDRDKIVVGPGVYAETIDIDHEGMKVESVAWFWPAKKRVRCLKTLIRAD